MKALNNKVIIKLLPEESQPKGTIFNRNSDTMKIGTVIDVGSKVDEIKIDDNVCFYVISMNHIKDDLYIISDRDIIFINDYPRINKIHIKDIENGNMKIFSKAKVIKSSSDDVKNNEEIYFKPGQSHILPDNSEIISETQVYYKILPN